MSGLTTVGSVADAVGQVAKATDDGIRAGQAAQQKQAGADAATAAGQAATLQEIDLAKRTEVAAQSTAANDPGTPDGSWFKRLYNRFTRANK
jgi:hypothetical protein